MTRKNGKYFLVGTPPELTYAAQAVADGYQLIGGSLHVFNRLSREGHAAIAAGPLIGAIEKEAIVGRVGVAIGELEGGLAELDCPSALRAIARAKLTKALFTFEGIRATERVLGGEVKRLDRQNNVVSARRLRGNNLRFAPGRSNEHAPPRVFADRSAYEMDLSSPSGQKLLPASTVPRFRIQAKDKRIWRSSLRNSLGDLPFFPQDGRTIRASFPRLTQWPRSLLDLRLDGFADPEIESVLEEELRCVCEGFFAYRSGMRKLLRQRGLPERAIFNHVSNEGTAGFFSALDEAGVACEMASHGCLVAYGQGPRHDAARPLANTIYNNFPGMARIVPRSPLQAKDASASQQITRTVRLEALTPPRSRSETFRAYYAPNFREWHLAFHGLTIDCFQTFRCIERFAEVVSGLPGFTVNLRVKTTPLDFASIKTMPVLRGLLPDDVAHLFRPEAGVCDASWGSHKDYLADSDLVVTEGLTAVMFEALEMRKPVLLLNADRRMVPSLPHRPAAELLAGDGRAAVYAASIEDDLPAVLNAIRRLHHGSPLTDREVEGYVWT